MHQGNQYLHSVEVSDTSRHLQGSQFASKSLYLSDGKSERPRKGGKEKDLNERARKIEELVNRVASQSMLSSLLYVRMHRNMCFQIG